MDTPLKSTRRRLKKVLKKSKTNLSVSTTNIYQKKLKSAINVSLNSTRTVRTLQANNRSLATSLEKMRQDFRQVHHHYTLLLEENYELREKILELQRVDASEKFIEREVNKRFEEHIEDVKKKLAVVRGLATGFLDAVTELSDVCFTRKSPTLEDLTSSESSYHNYSLLPNLQIISSDVSLADTSDIADIESSESIHRPEAEMGEADVAKSTPHKKNQLHEMTLIMEQSMLCSSAEGHPNTSSKFDTESTSSTSKKTAATKLPMRVLQYPRQQNKQSRGQARKATETFNKQKSDESLNKVLRRETFIITTDEPPDEDLITDIALPQFLASNYFTENEPVDLDIQDPVSGLSSPSRIRQPCEKNVQIGNTTGLYRISPKQSNSVTPHHSEGQSPNKLSPHLLPSPREMRQTRRQSLPRGTRSRSRLGQASPQKMSNLATHQDTEKQVTKKTGSVDKKSTTQTKKVKNPVSLSSNKMSPKHLIKPGDKLKQNLYISNEFNLVNVHKQKSEKSDNKASYAPAIKHFLPSQEVGEHTIFPADDMELTRMEEESIAAPFKPVNDVSLMYDSSDGNNTELESYLSAHSRSKPKQTGQAVAEAEGSIEEKVPDAVTMRFTKPGQFIFAASRKESDGTRKNIPLVIPKVRSKSKKQTTDMIEDLPELQPQSIFDFHDKTPVSLNSEKQKAGSVFSISDGESSLSPLMPLNKNRSRSGKSNSSSIEQSSKNASHSNSPESNGKKHALLCESFTFEVPLNDDSPTAKSTYRTRSRSRGRKQYNSECGKVGRKTRSQSRKRRALSNSESPVNDVTSSSSVVSSDVLSTNQTSPGTVDQDSGSSSKLELTSDGSKSDIISSTSHLDSNALYKQKELNRELFEEVSAREHVVVVEEIISSPKSPSISMWHISAKKKKKKGVYQAGEDRSAISAPAAIELFVLKTNEKRIEKEYTNLLNTGSEDTSESRQADEIKCLTSSVTSSLKSQDTFNFTPEIVMSEIAPDPVRFDGKSVNGVEGATTRSESKSLKVFNDETVSVATFRRKKKTRSRSISRRAKDMSPYKSISQIIKDDSELSSENANFIATRTDRTRGKKDHSNGSGESEVIQGKSVEVSIEDLAADGDSAVRTKFMEMKNVHAEAEVSLKLSEESSQLLEKLRHLKTPALSHGDEVVQPETTATSNDKGDTPQKNSRMSKIVKVPPLNRPLCLPKRPATLNSPESLTATGGKRRRAATKTSYAELPLNTKLRRGDPYTSHYCTSDKIDIFKSKATKKIERHDILGSLHNFSITEELGLPSEENA